LKRVKEIGKQWREAHLEQYKQYNKQWRAAHSEHIKKYSKQRYEDNPKYDRLHNREIRSKMFAAVGDVCVVCGEVDRTILEFDHIHDDGKTHPLFAGTGTNTWRRFIEHGCPPGVFQSFICRIS